jgi:hypothetical protein
MKNSLTLIQLIILETFLAYKSLAKNQIVFSIKYHLFVLRILILLRSRGVRLDVLHVLASSDRDLKQF